MLDFRLQDDSYNCGIWVTSFLEIASRYATLVDSASVPDFPEFVDASLSQAGVQDVRNGSQQGQKNRAWIQQKRREKCDSLRQRALQGDNYERVRSLSSWFHNKADARTHCASSLELIGPVEDPNQIGAPCDASTCMHPID